MNSVIVIGAGPAGLTAAYELNKRFSGELQIFESEDQVGGISKTVHKNGWRFDLGGHRFFSKSNYVNSLWDEMLSPEIFILRPRKSRIYYNGKYFDYPLKPINALFNLGIFETLYCIFSYFWVRIHPPKNQDSFEGWVAARFGWRLYKIFFKTYTEKVWGISTRELKSTWAAQRIKNLSLAGALKDAFGFKSKEVMTTLIDSFKYPKLGPGFLWENVAKKLSLNNVQINLNTSIKKVQMFNNKYNFSLCDNKFFNADAVFSSMPLSEVPKLLGAPQVVIDAAKSLRYRDFLIVAVPVKANKNLFDDNWIYIHDPKVKVGRIQNYLSWSLDLVKPGTSCLGLEYFVNKTDEFWLSPDSELINFAKRELQLLDLNCEFLDEEGYVVRVEKAYPVYDENYQSSTNIIREWLTDTHPYWFQIGRNGQHHYNNQDHSMLTAKYAVNKFLGLPQNSYWDVNLSDDYHEEIKVSRESPIFPA